MESRYYHNRQYYCVSVSLLDWHSAPNGESVAALLSERGFDTSEVTDESVANVWADGGFERDALDTFCQTHRCKAEFVGRSGGWLGFSVEQFEGLRGAARLNRMKYLKSCAETELAMFKKYLGAEIAWHFAANRQPAHMESALADPYDVYRHAADCLGASAGMLVAKAKAGTLAGKCVYGAPGGFDGFAAHIAGGSPYALPNREAIARDFCTAEHDGHFFAFERQAVPKLDKDTFAAIRAKFAAHGLFDGEDEDNPQSAYMDGDAPGFANFFEKCWSVSGWRLWSGIEATPSIEWLVPKSICLEIEEERQRLTDDDPDDGLLDVSVSFKAGWNRRIFKDESWAQATLTVEFGSKKIIWSGWFAGGEVSPESFIENAMTLLP